MKTELFQNNIKILHDYKYYYGPNVLSLVSQEYKNINTNERLIEEIQENDRILFYNELNSGKIIEALEKSDKTFFYKWKKTPLYLFYEEEYFCKLLNLEAVEKFLDKERIVFIVGWGEFNKYFSNMQTVLPDKIINDLDSKVLNIVMEYKCNREKRLSKARENITEYYSRNTNQIIENIRNKKYKILFMTTRFLGFRYLRDLYEGSVQAGYDAALAIEESNISRIYYELYIEEYKPDIIFLINQFRDDFEYIPAEPICVTWIVDRYERIYSKDTSAKLGKRDVVCNCVVNDTRLWEDYGYKKEELIELLYPGNDRVYREYALTQDEKELYFCDIVLVSNNTNYPKYIQYVLNKFPENVRSTVFRMSEEYYNMEYKGESIYGHEKIKDFIIQHFKEDDVMLEDEKMEKVFNWFLLIRYFARKHVLARWLIEANKYNIKMWGLDWCDMPEFQKYDMGVAPNGETLSKIYQSAKIAIATQPDITYPSRIAEITLSNTLALVGYIPPEYDIIPCKYLELGKNIACYYDREDLYNKLDYYLENERARSQMIQQTKKIIQQKLVVKIQAKDTFEAIEERYRKENAV